MSNKQRYESVEYGNIVDENSSDNVITLPILRPKIFLNPNEIEKDCTGFPLLKINEELNNRRPAIG